MGQNGRVSQRSEDPYSLIISTNKAHTSFVALTSFVVTCLGVTCFTVFAAALIAPLPASAKDAATSNKGLHLRQTGAYNNNYDIFVTPNAVRAYNLVTNCVIVSKAPDWNVYLWRDSSKQIAKVAFEKWCKEKYLRYAWAAELSKPIKTQSIKIEGRKHIIYTFGTTLVVEPILRSTLGSGKGGRGKPQGEKEEENHAEMECLDYANSDKIGPILDTLHSIPPVAGVPLTIKRIRASGNREFALSTQLIEEVPVKNSLLQIPKSYKPVDFSIDFMRGEARNAAVKSLFEELTK